MVKDSGKPSGLPESFFLRVEQTNNKEEER